MIELENLCKYYKLGPRTIVKAVDGANMKIHPKDFGLIMGRSGSGKTTLLSLISGLTKPTSGKVSIEGCDIWSLSDEKQSRLRNKKIGFIFQFYSLIPTLDVIDNLRLPTIFSREKTEHVYERATTILEMVGLSERMRAYPSQLSIGQMKRVAIARALMTSPEIVLADEPTADLDEATEKEIMEIMRNIHEGGATVLMVTHNPELGDYATRLFRMASGVLTEI